MITDAVLVRDNGVFCVIPDFIEAKRADVWVHVAWLDRVPLPTEDIGQFGSPATLSKATVAQSGANIQIEEWAYHTNSQLINVWATAASVKTDFLVAKVPVRYGCIVTGTLEGSL